MITPLPSAPTRQDPVNFAQRADDFLAALPTFGTEANALAAAVNTNTQTASNAATIATTAIQSINSALSRFTFSTTTTMADPGVGFIRFNNSTFSSITAIAIDAQSADAGNPNVRAILNTFADSTSAVKGQLRLTQAGVPTTFRVFNLTALTDNTGWLQFTVVPVASSGTLNNNDLLVLEYSRAGQRGDDGGVTLDTAQTITGTKTFTGIVTAPGVTMPSIGAERTITWGMTGKVVHLFGRDSDDMVGLFDSGTGMVRWISDVSGNFTAAGNITAGGQLRSNNITNEAGNGAPNFPNGLRLNTNAVLGPVTGDAPMYACRAWVNFNGTGTVAIRASGNVSSITDNGVGDYTVNFTTAMPDANYAACGMGNNGASQHVVCENSGRTASAFRVSVQQPGTSVGDSPFVNVTIFR